MQRLVVICDSNRMLANLEDFSEELSADDIQDLLTWFRIRVRCSGSGLGI
ncbi:MAG: hypothetical protein J5I98_33445 [Phaeodactylibacter sp.]|nr:hypothetical protein [Phaeodactylibacter sp.]